MGFTVVAIVAVVARIVQTETTQPDKLGPIIAETYNSGTGELAAYVYRVEKEHRFPNGKIEEGWLMRPVDVPGADPMWFVKPKKARVVWRK